MRKEIKLTELLPLIMLIVGLYLFPFSIVDSDFSRIPGDKVDSRFNNYILEHGYKYIHGEMESFWDAPFMYPYKNTIAFSDNLLGTLPVYSFFRSMGFDRETAFQWWFITQFALNFIACYYVLKKWSSNTLLSSVGAYIFAFSIYFLCHINHIQVLPRFMIPVAIYFFWKYFSEKKTKHLLYTLLALTFQFYCGVYMGFFLMYVLFFMLIGYLVLYRDKTIFSQYSNVKIVGQHLVVFILTFLLLYPLFSPYMEVSGKFGLRHFEEVSMYIPTWRAYFTATPESWPWRFLSWHIREQGGYWWEYMFFTGLLPWLTILLVPVVFLKSTTGRHSKMFLGFLFVSFFLCLIFSLKINDFTLYKLIYNVPGFGSMRSVNRLYNVSVFLQILIFVFVLKELVVAYPRLKQFLIVLPVLVVIDNSVTYWERTFYKSEVQAEVLREKEFISSHLDSTKLAIAYQHANFMGKETISHLNTMLACQDLNLKCVNAYAGLFPFNYQGFADGEGLDSLQRWMNYNQQGMESVQIITDYETPILSRRIGAVQCNGVYLSLDQGLNGKVFAKALRKEAAETFEWVTHADNFTVIRSLNGKYLCADISAGGVVFANREKAGQWEQFLLSERVAGQFAMKAVNGKFWSISSDASLAAVSETADGSTLFRIVKK